MTRYAISDLHGYYNLYREVKSRLKPHDILYVLGDCADRGPSGWRTLRAILTDPQCILLLGNHELMLRDVMDEWFKIVEEKTKDVEDCELTPREIADEEIIYTSVYELLLINGGEFTFWDWRDEEDLGYWKKRLDSLPVEIQLFDTEKPIILTHAGYTPWKKPTDIEDFVWDREHFFDKWLEEDSSIIIHGHTPNPFLYECLVEGPQLYHSCYYMDSFKSLGLDKTGAELWDITYSDGHKICIDPGTVVTHRGILINLETLEQEMVKFA